MESFSIDEVFLDMTGTGRIYPDPVETATQIKDRIRGELGFTVNVGIGRNKLCAKMASDFEKPDKVHTLFPGEIPGKMWPLPVRDLFTVGRASAVKLQKANISTIGALAMANLEDVQQIMGENLGRHVYEYANGIDESPVQEVPEAAKGYSAETTVEENLEELDAIHRMLLAQADIVAARMRKDGVKCRCVAITYRTLDFRNKSHQRKTADAIDSTTEIYELAKKLFRESWDGQPLRLIGLALTDLDRGEYEQLSLFVNEKRERMKKLDTAIDAIRSRYGNASVQRASTMEVERRVGRKHKAQMQNEIRGLSGDQ